MKKTVGIITAIILMSNMALFGCGDKNDSNKLSKNGAKNIDEVTEIYAEAYWTGNGELMLSLIPEDAKKYLMDKYYLTENQLEERVKTYYENEFYDADYSDLTIVERGALNDVSRFNRNLSEYNVAKAENAYVVCFEVIIDQITAYKNFSGDTSRQIYFHAFELDGRWYAYEAFEKIDVYVL